MDTQHHWNERRRFEYKRAFWNFHYELVDEPYIRSAGLKYYALSALERYVPLRGGGSDDYGATSVSVNVLGCDIFFFLKSCDVVELNRLFTEIVYKTSQIVTVEALYEYGIDKTKCLLGSCHEIESIEEMDVIKSDIKCVYTFISFGEDLLVVAILTLFYCYKYVCNLIDRHLYITRIDETVY